MDLVTTADPGSAAPRLPTESAASLARATPREKAALLRAILPRLVAAAPELVTRAAQCRGRDPSSAEAAQAWISLVVPLIACVRELALALEQVASRGRPSVAKARRGPRGRTWVSVRAPSLWQRLGEAGSSAEVLFEDGVRPDEVPGAQASAYRSTAEEASIHHLASADLAGDALLHALFSLFVEGRPVTLSPEPASAPLIPPVTELFAPLIERGWLTLSSEGLAEAPAESPVLVPWIVVPYLYAADELRFQARCLASALAREETFERGERHLLVLAEGWEQRERFLAELDKALAALPSFQGFRAISSDASRVPELPIAGPERLLAVVSSAGDDAARFLPALLPFVNDVLGGGRGLTLTLHPAQAEDPGLEPVIEETLLALRFGAIAVNAPSSRIRVSPSLPWGPHPRARAAVPGRTLRHHTRMLERVETVLFRAPVVSPFAPAHFCDNRRIAAIGPRLARLAAAPSPLALASLLGTLRGR